MEAARHRLIEWAGDAPIDQVIVILGYIDRLKAGNEAAGTDHAEAAAA